MVLEEKQIPHTIIEENLAEFSEELMRLHPQQVVPLMKYTENGKTLILYESPVMTEFLDEKFQENKLMPESPEDRARTRLWTYWVAHIFKADLDAYKYERPNLKPEEIDVLTARLVKYLTELDQAVASGYLVGNRFSLADIHVFPFIRQFYGITPTYPELERFTHLKAWLESIKSRPAFERVIAKKS